MTSCHEHKVKFNAWFFYHVPEIIGMQILTKAVVVFENKSRYLLIYFFNLFVCHVSESLIILVILFNLFRSNSVSREVNRTWPLLFQHLNEIKVRSVYFMNGHVFLRSLYWIFYVFIFLVIGKRLEWDMSLTCPSLKANIAWVGKDEEKIIVNLILVKAI